MRARVGPARDLSGNGLDGAVKAEWVNSPSGKALLFNGTSAHTVSLRLPEDRRFGRGSWTFIAWVKPTRLAIDDPQNRARYWPRGLSGRQCGDRCDRRRQALPVPVLQGPRRQHGAHRRRLGAAVKPGEWAHLAVVCDRARGRVWCYVNGFRTPRAICPGGSTGISAWARQPHARQRLAQLLRLGGRG